MKHEYILLKFVLKTFGSCRLCHARKSWCDCHTRLAIILKMMTISKHQVQFCMPKAKRLVNIYAYNNVAETAVSFYVLYIITSYKRRYVNHRMGRSIYHRKVGFHLSAYIGKLAFMPFRSKVSFCFAVIGFKKKRSSYMSSLIHSFTNSWQEELVQTESNIDLKELKWV